MVTPFSFRNPVFTARMGKDVDELSGGRLILGLGAGWHDPEYDAFGYPKDHRVDRFEEALRQAGTPYVVGRSSFVDNVRANLVGEALGWVKILVAPQSDKVLGVHAIGPHASEIVHLGAAVMDLSGTYRYFIDAVFNYPTLGEAYKEAAYDALAASAPLRDRILHDAGPPAPTAPRA